MKKIWRFDINNEINFHKRKITAPRVELSQTLIPLVSGLGLCVFTNVILYIFLPLKYSDDSVDSNPQPGDL